MKLSENRLALVARQEFLNGVRSKWFLLATFGLPLVMSTIIGLTLGLSAMQSDRPLRFVLVDESHSVGNRLAVEFPERFESGESKGQRRIEFDAASINSLVDVEQIMQTLSEKVLDRQLDGIVHLKPDFDETGAAEMFGLSVSNIELNIKIESALSRILREVRLKRAGIAEDRVDALLRPAHLDTYRVNAAGAQRDNLSTFALVYVLVLLLYISVIVYGARIGRAVLEEKVSRIVEVMLSAVSPTELLGGKVLGVGLVGLLQTGVWCVFGLVLMTLRVAVFGKLGEVGAYVSDMPDFPPSLVLYFLAWFLLGYFLYALIYALIAAVAGSEREAEQLQVPVSLFLLLPLIAQMAVIRNPDSTFSVVMSMIPFFSPIVMFMRIAVLKPPALQIAASLILCVSTIFIVLFIAARIYRVGILSSGRRPPFRQLIRWIFAG